MDNLTSFVLARAVHILAIVLWIGGVAFVTLVLIPALKKIPDESNRVMLFEQLEGRFANIAKITTLLTFFSGFYLVEVMQIWSRFLMLEFWWMHMMLLVWFVFTLVLFVLEPWFLHDWFKKRALADNDKTFKKLHTMHILLLIISLITIFGAMLGAHGFRF
jgi:uncharacterized membrane protein